MFFVILQISLSYYSNCGFKNATIHLNNTELKVLISFLSSVLG